MERAIEGPRFRRVHANQPDGADTIHDYRVAVDNTRDHGEWRGGIDFDGSWFTGRIGAAADYERQQQARDETNHDAIHARAFWLLGKPTIMRVAPRIGVAFPPPNIGRLIAPANIPLSANTAL